MKNSIIIIVLLFGINGFGQDKKQKDSIRIKIEFEKLQKQYKEQEVLLDKSKDNIRNIVQGITSLQINTNDTKNQKIINDTKEIYNQLSSLYKEQERLKKKYSEEGINDFFLSDFKFTKYEMPTKQEDVFTKDLFDLIITNKGLNEVTRKTGFIENFHTYDIYNPINFTTIIERMPKRNGTTISYEILNRSGLDYIQKGSQIHLKFDKEFIEKLTLDSNLDLQVLAYIVRKDKTIKPLSVLGFTIVNDNSNQVEKDIKNISFKSKDTLEYKYTLNFKNSTIKSLSGEVNLAWEDISKDDKIIISVINKQSNDVGFSTVLIVDEFGWTNGATGGFGFTKVNNTNSNKFNAAGTIGYAFRYMPRRSNSFWKHFLSPSFGPELNVQEVNNETSIGIGGFASTMLNTVKVGCGWIVNGSNSGKPYVSIGLNFIESYQKISELVSKTN